MSSRTWVKINCDRWFDGTIRKEPVEVRALWTDILALAGRTGQDGVIRLPGTEMGYTDDQLAVIFNVSVDVWLSAKERLSNHPSGNSENRIIVTSGNKIEIINWSSYQSEYVRQKGYRVKLHPRVTHVSDSRKCGENREDKNRLDLKDQKKDQEPRDLAKPARFTQPTIEQVMEYCRSRSNNVDPVRWYAHYTANGWKVGKNLMKNWKAAIVTWERQ